VIACNQYINPRSVVQAEEPFAGVQFSGNDFFDTRTGEVRQYAITSEQNSGDLMRKWRVTKLGQPRLER